MTNDQVGGAGELPSFCPAYTRAIEIIGRRWSGAIIRAMLAGASRYGEILSAIPGLSARLLSERLKELESEGVITRSVTPSTPVRIEYALTEKGRALAGVVHAVIDWVRQWDETGATQTSEATAPVADER